MKEKLKGNIWKLFVAEVTQREYYFPVLSIYFLTIPDATAQQIGLWTGIGYLAEFLFEVPSGYISDRIGHKKMLIAGKVAMICAALSFIHGGSLIFFVLGAIFTALSFAAQSGTHTAFLYETLVSTGQEKTLARTRFQYFCQCTPRQHVFTHTHSPRSAIDAADSTLSRLNIGLDRLNSCYIVD